MKIQRYACKLQVYMVKLTVCFMRMGGVCLNADNLEGRFAMSVSYDKLWRLMKDNKMTKRELAQAADFSQYMIGQFTKDAYVSLKEIETLCEIFHCKVDDIVEFKEG